MFGKYAIALRRFGGTNRWYNSRTKVERRTDSSRCCTDDMAPRCNRKRPKTCLQRFGVAEVYSTFPRHAERGDKKVQNDSHGTTHQHRPQHSTPGSGIALVHHDSRTSSHHAHQILARRTNGYPGMPREAPQPGTPGCQALSSTCYTPQCGNKRVLVVVLHETRSRLVEHVADSQVSDGVR
jgi:rubredoxin